MMPFISAVLGYDVFNPAEVIPEFTADVGIKKGEKTDYAILTNGEVYTDLDAPNRMDAKPFLVLDFAGIGETLLPELAKLTKESFNLESVISTAGQLKRILAAQFKQPEDEWARFLTTRLYEGSFTRRVRDQFGREGGPPVPERPAQERLGRAGRLHQHHERRRLGSGASPCCRGFGRRRRRGRPGDRVRRGRSGASRGQGQQELLQHPAGRQQPEADRAAVVQPDKEVPGDFR
ncbi:hypothetical protein [Amycolatopsis rubida]|nr:hypothetical protein [Amycolatopsis rubida]